MRKIGVWAKKNVLLAILAIIFVLLVMSVFLFSQEFKEGLTRSNTRNPQARTPQARTPQQAQQARTAEARSIDATRIADVKKAINMRNIGALAKNNASGTDFRSFKLNEKGEIIKGKYADYYGKKKKPTAIDPSSFQKNVFVPGGMFFSTNGQGRTISGIEQPSFQDLRYLNPETGTTSIAAIPRNAYVNTAVRAGVPDYTISFTSNDNDLESPQIVKFP